MALAVAGLYDGTCVRSAAQTRYNVTSSQAVQYFDKLKVLRPDLPIDDDTSQQVIRASLRYVCGESHNSREPYTTAEMRDGLYAISSGNMKMPEVTRRYGVPAKTMNTHLRNCEPRYNSRRTPICGSGRC